MTRDDEERPTRGMDQRLMRRLLGYLRPYRGDVALAVVVALLETAVQLVGPFLTKEAIDNGIRHRDQGHLDRVAALYLAVLVMGYLLAYLETRIMQRVGQNFMLDLRLKLFRHLQRLPITYFDRHAVGRIMTRLTNDVDVLNELFTSGVVSIVGDLFLLAGIVVAMVRLNVELMGVTLSVLPLIVILTLIFRIKVRRSFRDIRTRLARMNGFLNENLSGMTTVQALNREKRNYEEFLKVNAEHRDANLVAVRYNALLFPVLELVGALAVSLIVWYGGRQVMWTGITLGTLVAFLQYTQRFFRPISDLSEKYGIVQQAMASSERVFELLDTPADPALSVVEAASPSAPPRLRGEIEFDHVWFAYHGEDWVLRDVSFKLAPGEKLALVGATGAGKTTIASLLLRFYSPQRGAIRLDGKPLESYDVHALRRRIGLVLQDSFLFSGTIASNLALANGALKPGDLERAAREVHAHEFITQLPDGYEATVRERGASLSGGQRQLISFARALAADPDVLVLDEATASVDPRTEAMIQQALQRLMEGRTSLVIAHRLSTVQDASRVVVLHHGQVREIGTHAELMAARGIYYRLHQLQYFGARPDSTLPNRDWLDEPSETIDPRFGIA
jgi:ATP-binding cassette subfamily B protein